jgi:hypothetical protein
VDLKDFEYEISRGCQGDRMVDLVQALSHWPEFKVDEQTARSIRQGGRYRDLEKIAALNLNISDKVRLISGDNHLVAIMRPVFDCQTQDVLELKSIRVFNTTLN